METKLRLTSNDERVFRYEDQLYITCQNAVWTCKKIDTNITFEEALKQCEKEINEYANNNGYDLAIPYKNKYNSFKYEFMIKFANKKEEK